MIQAKFNNDFDNLLKESMPTKIAVAVSGGVDSLSLLYFISNWARGQNIEIFVFTVNHNLRKESLEEVSYVQSVANKLGHSFFELSWDCGENKSALQQRARDGRYGLMTNLCHDLGIQTLLTAHHLDDIFETYLMRKRRKSGTFGLSSSNSHFFNNIRILRPLFNFTKMELITYLKDQNIQWMEDFSNNSDLYERNRVRKEIANFTTEQKKELKNEIITINKKAKELNEELVQVMAESLQIRNEGFASIDLRIFIESNKDIQIQLLNHTLTMISGQMYTARFRNIEKLLNKIAINEKIECSIHSCILKQSNDKIWIFREKSAIKSVNITDKGIIDNIFRLKLSQFWDNRFDIILNYLPQNAESYFISNLSFDDYLLIKDDIDLSYLAKISDNHHKSILFTLPVIKNIEKVVAIPHISYYSDFDSQIIKEIIFKPKFVSRFTHFL